MAKCDKCKTEGYAHVIDKQHQDESHLEPIFTTSRKRKYLCTSCTREMRLEYGIDRVKKYLNGVV